MNEVDGFLGTGHVRLHSKKTVATELTEDSESAQ